ncbi:MAG: hypothetical protein DYG89_25445 [Caldilinea sp. CFX5]|nr:hypothetical protein [Caldilinea sp. CFX5]
MVTPEVLKKLKPINSCADFFDYKVVDFKDWYWKPWLKSGMDRLFIIVNEQQIMNTHFQSFFGRIKQEYVFTLAERGETLLPIVISKSVFEYWANNVCPVLAQQLLYEKKNKDLLLQPNVYKQRLWGKKTLAYFFYNWLNSYVENLAKSGAELKNLNGKVERAMLAALILKKDYVETQRSQICKTFTMNFNDFPSSTIANFISDGIHHFPLLVRSMRGYLYNDQKRPDILYKE